MWDAHSGLAALGSRAKSAQAKGLTRLLAMNYLLAVHERFEGASKVVCALFGVALVT